jgi:hypothetical protein
VCELLLRNTLYSIIGKNNKIPNMEQKLRPRILSNLSILLGLEYKVFHIKKFTPIAYVGDYIHVFFRIFKNFKIFLEKTKKAARNPGSNRFFAC